VQLRLGVAGLLIRELAQLLALLLRLAVDAFARVGAAALFLGVGRAVGVPVVAQVPWRRASAATSI
jgi:hypothetical protein